MKAADSNGLGTAGHSTYIDRRQAVAHGAIAQLSRHVIPPTFDAAIREQRTGVPTAGTDGLDCIRPLIQQARQYLADPGQLVIEIAACQRQAVIDLATEQGLRHPSVLVDHEKLPRVLVADA